MVEAANRIADEKWRTSFLEQVPENARLRTLAGGGSSADERALTGQPT